MGQCHSSCLTLLTWPVYTELGWSYAELQQAVVLGWESPYYQWSGALVLLRLTWSWMDITHRTWRRIDENEDGFVVQNEDGDTQELIRLLQRATMAWATSQEYSARPLVNKCLSILEWHSTLPMLLFIWRRQSLYSIWFADSHRTPHWSPWAVIILEIVAFHWR